MFKDSITYTDYDGNERTKTLYFNLSKAEFIEIEMLSPGTITTQMEQLVEELDVAGMMKLLKFLIVKSYGEKSADGNKFVKSQEKLDSFLQTEAYSEFLMKLLGDAEYATKFIYGLMPDADGIDEAELLKQVNEDPRLLKLKESNMLEKSEE